MQKTSLSYTCSLVLMVLAYAMPNLCAATTPAAPLVLAPDAQASAAPAQGATASSTSLTTTHMGSDDEPADVSLNFEGASLSMVVSYLTQQKKAGYIPNKDLDAAKVTLINKEPMTMTKAWNIMLTLLDMNNFALVNINNIYQIVNKPDSGNQPLHVYSSANGYEPEQLPDNDKMIRYIYYLKNMKNDMASSILAGMLPDKSVQTIKDLDNILFITERAQYIKSAMKVIKILDQTGLRQSIKQVKLQYTDSETIAKLLTDDAAGLSIGSKDANTVRFITPTQRKKFSYFSSDMRIVSDAPRNALIFLGLDNDIDKVIDFVKKFLDVDQNSAANRLHVHEVKYLDPQKLATLLTALVKPPQGVTKLSDGDFRFFDDVVITSETPSSGSGTDSNFGCGSRLIVACNKEDWVRLEKLIEKLDKPQPQVGLEILICDVTTDQTRSIGAQLRAKGSFPLQFQTANLAAVVPGSVTPPGGTTAVSSLQGNLGTLAIGAGGATSVTVGDSANPWMVIQTILSNSNTNIISQPFIIANNRQACKFSTQAQRTTPGAFSAGLGSGTAIVQQTAQTAANNTVTITPRINGSGIIDMTITIDLADFTNGDNAQIPDTTTRNLSTRVSVGTGEVLVLGGMAKTSATETITKTPLFADIPILGTLFKSKKKGALKSNVMIFIRPSIIRPIADSTDEYTQLKLDYSKYQVLKCSSYGEDKDPIQRWFFKPRKSSIKKTLANIHAGRFDTLDDFAEGKNQPQSVNLPRDPYFMVSETLETQKKPLFSRRSKVPTLADIARKKPVTDSSGIDPAII